MKKSLQLASIDIGSSKVTTIIASKSEETEKVRVVGVSSLESKGIRKSQIVDIDETLECVTESVESAERMAGASITQAVVSVSGVHIESQNSKGLVAVQEPELEITANDVDRVIDASKAVPLPNSREILHVIPRFFIIDNQEGIKDPVGMSGVRLEAETHLITGSSMVLKNMSKVIGELGIDTQGLIFSGLASAEAVLTDTEKELGVILLDIGGGTTSLAMYVDGSLSHSAVIPVGAKNVTNDVAIGLRVTLDSAEKIKRALNPGIRSLPKALDPKNPVSKKQADEIDISRLGLNESMRKVSRKAVAEGIVRPRLNEIFELAKAEIQKSGFANMTPAGVVITGGGALTYNALDAARRVLGVQARIGTPTGLSGLVDEIQTPEYACATGLILHTLKNQNDQEKSSLNIGKITSNLQFKGSVKKLLSFFKSFLP